MSRILVVDDNVDLRDTVSGILTADGYDVEVANDGAAGLSRLRQGAFALVVTDLFMPEQDGIEMIPQIRGEMPDVRILAISGAGGKSCSAERYLNTALEIGADAALPKPFDKAELLAIVRRLLRASPDDPSARAASSASPE